MEKNCGESLTRKKVVWLKLRWSMKVSVARNITETFSIPFDSIKEIIQIRLEVYAVGFRIRFGTFEPALR